MKNILVTGATGFLGKNLVKELMNDYHIVIASRRKSGQNNEHLKEFVVGDFSNKTNFSESLKNIDCVIHAAGIAHKVNQTEQDLSALKMVNAQATIHLASQAVKLGVKRFIFISSIGVNGIKNNKPFNHKDIPNPQELYAFSKLDAEDGLRSIAKTSNMEIVIIRPPLIYGADAPGNFKKLLNLSKSNLILPFGNLKNMRSFVSIWNILDLIKICIEHPNASGQIFLASDDDDLSTSEFLKKLISATSSKTKLINTSPRVLLFIFCLLGKKNLFKRFSNSLTIDIAHTKKTLDWHPPLTIDESIKKCIN